MGEPVYQYERKIYKNENDNNFMKKEKKENVVDGNEFKAFNKDDIKWD